MIASRIRHVLATLLTLALLTGSALAGSDLPPANVGQTVVSAAVGDPTQATVNASNINAALAKAGKVVLPQIGKIYTNAPLIVPSNTDLECTNGAVITQANLGAASTWMIQNANFTTAFATVTLVWNGGMTATVSWTAHGLSPTNHVLILGTRGTTDSAFSGNFLVENVIDANTFVVDLRRYPGAATAAASNQPGTIYARPVDHDITIGGCKFDYNTAQNGIPFGASGLNTYVGFMIGVDRLWIHDTAMVNTPGRVNPVITANISTGAITGYNIVSAGSGMGTNTPTLQLVGYTAGTAATAPTVTLTGGVVSAVNGGTGGTSYTVPPAVVVALPEEMKLFWNLGGVRDFKADRNTCLGNTTGGCFQLVGPAFDGKISDTNAETFDDVIGIMNDVASAYSAVDVYRQSLSNGGDIIGVTVEDMAGWDTQTICHVYGGAGMWTTDLTLRRCKGHSFNHFVVAMENNGDTGSTDFGSVYIDDVQASNNTGIAVEFSDGVGGAAASVNFRELHLSKIQTPTSPFTTGLPTIGFNNASGMTLNTIDISDSTFVFPGATTGGTTNYAFNVNSSGGPTIGQLSFHNTSLTRGGLISLQAGTAVSKIIFDNIFANTSTSVLTAQTGWNSSFDLSLTHSRLVNNTDPLAFNGGGSAAYTVNIFLADNSFTGAITNGIVRVAGGSTNPPTLNVTSGGNNTGIPTGKCIVTVSNTQNPIVNLSAPSADCQVDLSNIGSVALGRNPGSIVYNTNAALGTLGAAGLVTNDATTAAGSWHLNTAPTLVY